MSDSTYTDKTSNLEYFLTDIADALRTKNNTSDPINAQDFSTLILAESNTGELTAQSIIDALGYVPEESLVSGQNIKTINGESILGEGNLIIEGDTESTVNSMLSLTYDELKSLRDNSQLVPGQQYRITDYVTTTSQTNTQSAGHQFDVIVTADSENALNEVARAIQHEGDTYFADYDLNAWQLWYCLDNDADKFDWADTANGKGVIYRMIDENNNDCPYDFKNIQFKHPRDKTTYPDYYYTFSTVIDGTVTDHSLLQGYCYSNTMKEYIASNKQRLNNNVFLNTSETDNCHSNSFEFNCYSNSFGGTCYYNSFGNSCHSNSFEVNCYSNSFEFNCYSNSFGFACYYNSFGNGCRFNSFGYMCLNNSFGFDCNFNSFGNGCQHNFFGNGCQHNSFGNNCYFSSFGNGCQHNSFGNYCDYNSFGNYCQYNSFKIGADKTSTLKNYVYYNHFDDGCSYNVIWNADTTSSSVKLQNINVNRGVSGKSSAYNMINITTLGQNYELQVANNSQGAIKIYCEADLIS